VVTTTLCKGGGATVDDKLKNPAIDAASTILVSLSLQRENSDSEIPKLLCFEMTFGSQ
jgi:hypothetical protein